MWPFKKKKLKAICKNCVLFDRNTSVCKIVVLVEGERLNIPVEGADECFYKNKFTAITEKGKEEFEPDIEQVRWWVEDPETGEQTKGNGIVKIQYNKNFFSPKEDE